MSGSARSQGLGADLDSMSWGNRRRFEYILVSGLGRSLDSDGVCVLIYRELARVQRNPLIEGKEEVLPFTAFDVVRRCELTFTGDVVG